MSRPMLKVAAPIEHRIGAMLADKMSHFAVQQF
jgi:hypothetical protein